MKHSKRVAVVGAGPCGLVALKEMLEQGHNATLYERSEAIGGVFASATAYPNLHLTISNWAMAFSDFPDPTRLRYPTAREYLRYLHEYVRHFNLKHHIQLRSRIRTAALDDNGIWSLEIEQNLGVEVTLLRIQVDALIVASGSNQIPNEVPATLKTFSGRLLHSSRYDEAFKSEVGEKGRRVLVVGGGESGADISAELGDLSPNVTVSLAL
jgi:dimethylaniline monooxygenase (N-oxide forming)